MGMVAETTASATVGCWTGTERGVVVMTGRGCGAGAAAEPPMSNFIWTSLLHFLRLGVEVFSILEDNDITLPFLGEQ